MKLENSTAMSAPKTRNFTLLLGAGFLILGLLFAIIAVAVSDKEPTEVASKASEPRTFVVCSEVRRECDYPVQAVQPNGEAIRQAVNVAQDGDTILIKSGHYQMPATSININKILTLQGEGNGTELTVNDSDGAYIFYAVESLNVINIRFNLGTRGGVLIDSTIADLHVSMSYFNSSQNNQILLGNARNVKIDQSVFDCYARCYGISTLDESHHIDILDITGNVFNNYDVIGGLFAEAEISNLYLKSNIFSGLNGIYLANFTSGNILNNTFYNLRDSIHITGSTIQEISIRNNIISGGNSVIFLIYGLAATAIPDFKYNLSDNLGNHELVRYNQEPYTPDTTNLLNVAPKFISIEKSDFRIQKGSSPAVNAGDTDFLSNDPDGSRNDIGAYGGPFACLLTPKSFNCQPPSPGKGTRAYPNPTQIEVGGGKATITPPQKITTTNNGGGTSLERD